MSPWRKKEKNRQALAEKGAMGRFAVDFISVQQPAGDWKHYAIEINLRRGGTTHPFLMPVPLPTENTSPTGASS